MTPKRSFDPTECEHMFLFMLTQSPGGEWECTDCKTVISYASGKREVKHP